METIIDITISKLKDKYHLEYLWYNICDVLGSKSLAEANIISHQISFSTKLFNTNINSGYKKERDLMNKHKLNHIEFVKWIVCHEYAHIYYQQPKHTKDFFLQVEAMYQTIK
jgi:hypothetical protein